MDSSTKTNENNISYSQTIILEEEDMINISVDVPTHNIIIKFKPDDNMIAYGYSSIAFNNYILLEKETDNTLKLDYSSWVSPRDSYVVAWWKK